MQETCRVGEFTAPKDLQVWLDKQNADGFRVVTVTTHNKHLIAVVAKTNGSA